MQFFYCKAGNSEHGRKQSKLFLWLLVPRYFFWFLYIQLPEAEHCQLTFRTPCTWMSHRLDLEQICYVESAVERGGKDEVLFVCFHVFTYVIKCMRTVSATDKRGKCWRDWCSKCRMDWCSKCRMDWYSLLWLTAQHLCQCWKKYFVYLHTHILLIWGCCSYWTSSNEMPILRAERIIEQFNKRGAQHFPAGSVEINEKPSVGTVGVAVNLAPS